MGLPLDVTDSPPFNYVAHTGPTNTSFVGVELNVPYTICEILIAIGAIFGNGLVIIAFVKERKLRKLTNYYIVSLAVADLLVGLFAIPFAILASVGLPPNLHACLFTLSILMVLFTISIFSLMAVSIDRYWAILYPMGYSRDVHTKTVISIIGVCWVAGTLLGFLPLLGWNTGKMNNHSCMFRTIMDYNYLVFLYFATAVLPALLIAAFYAHIYRIIIKQRQQIIAMNPSDPGGGSIVRHLSVHHGGDLGDNHRQTTKTVLCRLGAVRKREIKAIQNLFSIVIFFIICWFPLHTVNCVIAFCPQCEINDFLINFCIVLSHINSVGNPFLYAYHLKDFRIAIKKFIWRFVFRHSDIKFNTVSVIYDRNFLAGSQRQLQRFSNFDRPRGQKQSSLQVVDGSRMDGVYFENHVSSIQVKETHQNARNIDIEVNSAVLSNSTANKQTSEKKLVNDHGMSSSMNEQTLKSLASVKRTMIVFRDQDRYESRFFQSSSDEKILR
ncbi:adenosine receptor A2b isoform X1 [Monomorium pharaonis]|uniref:adenosine receptor A2b isoform X1 n=1 Tax=Monomorium pharaonis TaxID=307658 RepID=UPI00063F625E|nr:adenosine receptor A2b isoform X1 [Monomorium pharaonis]